MLFTARFIAIGVFGALLIVCATVNRSFLWLGLAVDGALLVAALLDFLACPVPPEIEVTREREEKLSLGAENAVTLKVRNRSRRPAVLRVRDEIPTKSTADRQEIDLCVEPGERTELTYHVTPLERGDHAFGDIYLRSSGPYGLIIRQAKIPARQSIRVYPNLIETAKYDLLLRRGRLLQLGLKPAARLGLGTEFESLREYQPDDEYRQIDWKATARRGTLVSRAYQAERMQNIIIVLDVGRTMCVRTGLSVDEEHVLSHVDSQRKRPETSSSSVETPVEGRILRQAQDAKERRMTKLDYAVNAALMLAYVASSSTGDRVGLLTFADRVTGYLPPRKGKAQLFAILQTLYNLGTTTVESDYASALRHLAARWRKRSLIVVFTDVLDVESSRGLISHLAALSSTHLCLCVLVSDPAIAEAANAVPHNAEQVYQQAVARQVIHERDQAKAALASNGVVVLDALPTQLSPATVSKYLQLKSRARL